MAFGKHLCKHLLVLLQLKGQEFVQWVRHGLHQCAQLVDIHRFRSHFLVQELGDLRRASSSSARSRAAAGFLTPQSRRWRTRYCLKLCPSLSIQCGCARSGEELFLDVVAGRSSRRRFLAGLQIHNASLKLTDQVCLILGSMRSGLLGLCLLLGSGDVLFQKGFLLIQLADPFLGCFPC